MSIPDLICLASVGTNCCHRASPNATLVILILSRQLLIVSRHLISFWARQEPRPPIFPCPMSFVSCLKLTLKFLRHQLRTKVRSAEGDAPEPEAHQI